MPDHGHQVTCHLVTWSPGHLAHGHQGGGGVDTINHRYETEDPSEYRTEEETEVGETEGEVTEMEEETEMEESGLDEEEDTEVEEEFETRDSFHTEEEVRYSPRARPKSR